MAAVDHRKAPGAFAIGAHAARPGHDHGAPFRGVDGIGDHKPRHIGQAIRILERDPERTLQRIADRMVGDVDGLRRRQSGEPLGLIAQSYRVSSKTIARL